ncbi:MAG: fibronectin type III domain-containing protein [Bacteroidota bacterium]
MKYLSRFIYCFLILYSFSASGQTPITWQNLQGVELQTNGSLFKTAPSGNTAGGSSLEAIDDNGWVEFIINENSAGTYIGLSSTDSDVKYQSIDFAFECKLNGKIVVLENGNWKRSLGTYQIGETYRIERIGSEIHYKKGNQTFYISQRSSIDPLVVDASIYLNGARIESVRIHNIEQEQPIDSGIGEFGITWQKITNLSKEIDNSLVKTSPSQNDAGASSEEYLSAGTDGELEFAFNENSTGTYIGLSDDDNDVKYQSIDFAITCAANGKVQVLENGNWKHTLGDHIPGIKYQIERENGVIYFKKEGVVSYTSQRASSSKLLVDVSIFQNGSAIGDVILNSNVQNINPLLAPSGLRTELVTGNSILLTWEDTNEEESGYEIYKSVSAGESGFTLLTTADANKNSFIDNNLIDETEYFYRIRAISDGNTSPYSNIVNHTTTKAEEYLESIWINFSNTSQAEAPWNNTSKVPLINDVFSNLKNGEGTISGLRFFLRSDFGGVFDQGAQTGDGSGIVPDEVLKEYYWFGIFDAPEEVLLEIQGLDRSYTYEFNFLGSSTFNNAGIAYNGETVYTIPSANSARSVALDVQANTNEMAVLTNVNPGIRGTVTLKISKGLTARAGYINALIIKKIKPDNSRYTPVDFQAVGDSEDVIKLSWEDNSINEYGFEIQRSETNEVGSFEIIHTTGPNEVTYVDADVIPGKTYYYKIRSMIPLSDPSDFSEVSRTSTIVNSIKVNISGLETYNADAPWNNILDWNQNENSLEQLVSVNGVKTDIGFRIDKPMDALFENGMQTGDDSGVYPDIVLKSGVTNNVSGKEGEFTLYGLDPNGRYNLKFLGSATESGWKFTDFIINDEVATGVLINNTTHTARLNKVKPNEAGEITFRVRNNPVSNVSIFSAFELEALETDIVTNAERVLWAIADGSWNDPAIWSYEKDGEPSGTYPKNSDQVNISGFEITVTDQNSCGSISLQNQALKNTLLLIDGGTLLVDGEVTIAKKSQNERCRLKIINNGNLETLR